MFDTPDRLSADDVQPGRDWSVTLANRNVTIVIMIHYNNA